MARSIAIALVTLAALAVAPCACLSHPGGLDKSGGHTDRKTGQYHYHRNPSASEALTPSAPLILSEHTRQHRIQEYFRAANANVLSQGYTGKQKRDVSGSQRRRVLERDGNRCVICGSSQALEVDHMRALQNGGDNSMANLATLCDGCHTIKTRMDGSLNRKLRGR